MMKLINNPRPKQWGEIIRRPSQDFLQMRESVASILDSVRQEGDAAVRRLTKQFDGATPGNLQVSEKEMNEADSLIGKDLKQSIQLAAANIHSFHKAQLKEEPVIETMPGIRCWRKAVGIERVGLYIPGGSAPLFSTVLMLAIPASLAGCREIILCTPPARDGSIHPAIRYAAKLTGVTRVYRIGGAQAIAAMAYGTETVPAVYKIFGPGNQYVNLAKQLVQLDGLAIDMPAGPSEVCVLADETADPGFVAADLLSQAEHGSDSQVLLVTTSEKFAGDVITELASQLARLPRKNIAEAAMRNSHAVTLPTIDEALRFVNAYAPEHLILCCQNPSQVAQGVINAGSVFIGNFSPEAAGDYASGTNHTLPTNGFARSFSGVSVDSFLRKITFQQLTREGLISIAPAVIRMAEEEGLAAHAEAVSKRIQQ